MAVGKGSIQRVKAASNATAEEIKKEPAEQKGADKASVAVASKKAPAKKTVAKAKTATVKKDDLHEKKFEMIDGIYSDLPTYLL